MIIKNIIESIRNKLFVKRKKYLKLQVVTKSLIHLFMKPLKMISHKE